MKWAALMMAGVLWGCAPTQSGRDGGENFGLPPLGDAGVRRSMGEWEQLAAGDPEGYRLIVSFARSYNMQGADFDGDGELDMLVRRDPDGTIVRTFELYNPYSPGLTATTFPDGRETLTIDPDFDGRQNVTIEKDPRTFTRVEQRDLNLNDRFEHRRTVVADEAAQTELVIEEEDLSEMGTWVETARYTLNLDKNQGTCARGQGLSNFPVYGVFNAPTSTSSLGSSYPNIIIVQQDAIACNASQTTAVQAAMACALKRLSCLDDASAALAAQVRSALSSKKLYIGCDNACPAADATTTSPSFGPFSAGRMNLRSIFDTLAPDVACTIVMHELMHFADAEMKADHENGEDRVYACARYCNKCVKRGNKMPPPSDMDDCVACAESVPERMKCGVKNEVQRGTCPNLDLCHAGLSGNTTCASCDVTVAKDCKGQRIDDRETFLCCAMCPATHTTNDKPCSGSPTLANSCNLQPPYCP